MDDSDILTPVVVVVEAGLVDVVVVGTDVVGASVVVRGTVIVGEAEMEVVGEFPFLTWADATTPKPSVIASTADAALRRTLGRTLHLELEFCRYLTTPISPEPKRGGGREDGYVCCQLFRRPADSESPMALRPSLAGGLPLRLLLISRRLPISLRKSRCTTDQ